ncbi:hypothetical protein H2203_000463 [Taxawa tesnikishii (nom. ined.)]|nr:hypothetical protein H2203_000463 [Dothideales sp. JES 119]
MPDFKGLAKGGWHPEKRGGGKEGGIRSEFKGVNTIAGWMGKGKDPYQESRSHQSAPLSSLRDPASFAPPPKHVHYHGASAAQSSASSPSYPQHTGGLGAPISQDVILRQQEAEQAQARAEEEETNRPPSPPKPYRVDTTGLSTTNLPKPPVRRSGGSSPSPIPAPAARKPAGPPGLPPRLPPRQNSHPDPNSPAPPPTYGEAVQQPDQGALSRLGQAGVSVPGLSIGRSASPPKPVQSPPLPARGATQSPSVPARAPVLSPPAPSRAPTQSPSVPARGPQAPQLSELQSRFAKMSTPSSTAQENANQGTTWAQKTPR